MSKKQPKQDPSAAEQLKAAEAEVERLRQMVETQTAAAALHQSRLASVLPTHRAVGAELMVGIRNISDETIGLKSKIPGEPEIQLHADLGQTDPASVGVISYAWWRDLRQSSYVERGMLMRDDAALGESFAPAPPDRPQDLPAAFYPNAIVDPRAWIDSRDEDQLRADLEKITSEPSLWRLRRVVDEALRTLAQQWPDDPKAGRRAKAALPAKLRLVGTLTTMRIEPEKDDFEPMIVQ